MKLRSWVLGLLVLLASSCKVEFDESMPFYCEEDEDCGGGGYVCIESVHTPSRHCCTEKLGRAELNTDPNNCGLCGNTCASNQRCSAGKCS
ncbi:MAG: hypothetical protein FWG75_03995 [Cystobacterineae bacterium]|nr:hypothetical protein [Cystobacterineae bacterium]